MSESVRSKMLWILASLLQPCVFARHKPLRGHFKWNPTKTNENGFSHSGAD